MIQLVKRLRSDIVKEFENKLVSNRRVTLFLMFVVPLLIGICFVIVYEWNHHVRQKDEVAEMASLFRQPLWDYNNLQSEQSARILVDSRRLKSIRTFNATGEPDSPNLDPAASELLSEYNNPKEPGIVEMALSWVWLVRNETSIMPIFYSGKQIGIIEVVHVNRNIYVYFIAAAFLVLISLLLSAYVRVVKQGASLEVSLNQIRELKAKQDGDYFLTSLLIDPLQRNKVDSESVAVTTKVMQYKKFKFGKWQKEIGGDICVAETINLSGRQHTFIVTGDAMGKSLQGAGGVFVFGSVLAAFLERTALLGKGFEITPSQWLKSAFLELHRVFLSFDGSMLMSTFMAIIDDESGEMYFINAAHPYTVLYRNGQARFMETLKASRQTDDGALIYRKLGTTEFSKSIAICKISLLPGDVIISGSDGRDDILLGFDKEAGKIINEDENLFLSTVEKTDGDLEKIHDMITAGGQLTDDLCLLRCQYRETGAGETAGNNGVAKAEVESG